MPVQLIDDNERLVHTVGESRFYYRRIPSGRRGRLIKQHTKRGVVDWTAVTAELLRWAITGWDEVYSGGAVVPYDNELVPRLPEEVTIQILDLAQAAEGEAAEGETAESEAAEKN